MSTTATTVMTRNSRRHAGFVAFVLISSVAFYKTLSALGQYSLRGDSSSHIILIPLVALFLLYSERQTIFSTTRTSIGSGVGLALGGLVLYWLANRGVLPQDGNWPLSLETISLILVCVGGFLLCYGFVALRAAAFPLFFLLLMVPLPDAVLDRVIHALQEGSTE